MKLKQIQEARRLGQFTPQKETLSWLSQQWFNKQPREMKQFIAANEEQLNSLYDTLEFEMGEAIADAGDPEDWGRDGFGFDCSEEISYDEHYEDVMKAAYDAKIDFDDIEELMCDQVYNEVPNEWLTY